MGFIKEFKEFAMKGNVMDMACKPLRRRKVQDAGRGSGGWCIRVCLRTVHTEHY